LAQKVLDPTIVKSWPVEYWIASGSAANAISPDGRYMLLVQAGSKERVVAAIPLTPDSTKEVRGVYYQVSEVTGRSEIWYGALGKTPVQPEENKPVRIAGGYWQAYPDIPVYGQSLAAIIGDPSGKTELWLLGSEEITKVDEWPGSYTPVIAFNEDTLVTWEIIGESRNNITVRSMYAENVAGDGT
jgi:hypothetical protein